MWQAGLTGLFFVSKTIGYLFNYIRFAAFKIWVPLLGVTAAKPWNS